jgi:hypothetical protein
MSTLSNADKLAQVFQNAYSTKIMLKTLVVTVSQTSAQLKSQRDTILGLVQGTPGLVTAGVAADLTTLKGIVDRTTATLDAALVTFGAAISADLATLDA